MALTISSVTSITIVDQRALGFSMRVERSDVLSVKEKLNALKRKLNTPSTVRPSAVEEYNNKLTSQETEKEEFKKRKKEEKLLKKAQECEDNDQKEVVSDPEMAALMGFGGFGGKRKG